MKALVTKSFILFSLFLSVQSLSAKNLDSGPSVNDQIRSLLIDFPKDLVDSQANLRISFIINDQSKIVILSTDNEELDKFVKSSLNYKTLKNHSLKANQLYHLPVKLVKA